MRFAMPRTVPPGLWRRVPPAIFPPILGALALILAWRGAAALFALDTALIEAGAGAMLALTLFAVLAYAVKLGWRPAVLHDELTILPGRSGVGAGVLALYLLAGILAPYAPTAARMMLVLGMLAHVIVLAVLLAVYRDGPAERRQITPAWHINWAGFFVAARVAPLLGWPRLAEVLFWPSLAAAAVIWAVSARQFLFATPPAPLRPLLAIHVAPFALTATVGAGLGYQGLAIAFAMAGLALLLVLAASARWLLAAGFSPFWGALTFPLAAMAGAWIALAQDGVPGARIVAGLLLVAATLVNLPILFLVLRDWARGRLATRTNAAIA